MAAGAVDPDKWNQSSTRAGAPGNLGAAGGHDCSKGVWTDTHERLGRARGDIETFIEVEFDLDGKKVIPDGLIRVSRGSRVWAA